MKFKKLITVAGKKNSIFEGTILVEETSELRTVHNRVLHEEETKRINYFVVSGFIDSKPIYRTEVYDFDRIPAICEEAEKQLREKLTSKANEKEPTVWINEVLELGFTKL